MGVCYMSIFIPYTIHNTNISIYRVQHSSDTRPRANALFRVWFCRGCMESMVAMVGMLVALRNYWFVWLSVWTIMYIVDSWRGDISGLHNFCINLIYSFRSSLLLFSLTFFCFFSLHFFSCRSRIFILSACARWNIFLFLPLFFCYCVIATAHILGTTKTFPAINMFGVNQLSRIYDLNQNNNTEKKKTVEDDTKSEKCCPSPQINIQMLQYFS